MARRWNKERIVAAIRSEQKHDPSLRHVCIHDKGLYYAAYRFFGSWRKAVLAAGAKPFNRQWTKESIVRAIRDRHKQCLPILGITAKDPALYAATQRHFGGWPQAMLAAGLPWKPKKWWSRERVMAAIQSRYQQGLPLCGLHKTDRPLAYAARKYFGSWPAAVAAAGVPDGWQHTWSRERLITMLQTYGEPGHPLASGQVPATLRRAASECFGSWHAALAAAGRIPLGPPPVPRKRWTDQGVLTAIRLRSRHGKSMTIAANGALARAAIRRFGTWNGALQAAGVESQVHQTWTPQRVLDEIQALHRCGAFTEGDQIEDSKLMHAARRRFGGWHRALVAAGVRSPEDDEGRRWKWPRRHILEAIQDRYVQGLSMFASHDRSLSDAAVRVSAVGVALWRLPESLPQR